MAISYDFYDGSRRFLWFSEKTGLPIDQTNFIACEVFGLFLAFVLRYALHHTTVSATIRHLYSGVSGLFILYFCHGRETIHLVILAAICYLVMSISSPRYSSKLVFAISFLYLSYIHTMRIVYHYGSPVLDVAGPVMLLMQKLTLLAFGLSDGLTRDFSQLTNLEKEQALRKLPSPIEFFSYAFQFQTVLCGPLTFFPDYKRFIEGTAYEYFSKKMGRTVTDGTGKLVPMPDPPFIAAVLRKIFGAIVFGVLMLTVYPQFPVSRLREADFALRTPLKSQMWELICITTVARFKYYHAWLIADAIANASGLGFNGYDFESEPKWDLISNINIPMFEFATSFRNAVQNWNKGTMKWLRFVCYERSPEYIRTILTYGLASLWHGFYTGYYTMFLTGALFTMTERIARRSLRQNFQSNKATMILYELVTFIFTKLAIAYLTFPFLLFDTNAIYNVYINMNCFLHVTAVIALFMIPIMFHADEEEEGEENIKNLKMNESNGLKLDNHVHQNGLVNGDKKLS